MAIRRELAKTGRTPSSRRKSREALEALSPRRLFDNIEPDNARLILLAAIGVFAGRGYHAATTREIASALDLSPAAVYSHFPTKADLLFEVSLRGNAEIVRLLKVAVADVEGPVERITAIVRASVLWHAEEHISANAINSNFRFLNEEQLAPIMKLRREATAMVQSEIKRGVKAGVFRQLDVKGATIALLRMVDIAPWYSETGPMTPERLAEVYIDLILHMLSANSPPGNPA